MLDGLGLDYCTYLVACIAACSLLALGALLAEWERATSLANGEDLGADKRVGNGGAAAEGLG